MFYESEGKDAWFRERIGRFTASEIQKLLVPGKSGNMFGAGAWTYIQKKAIEKLTAYYENPALEYVKSLRYGKDMEQMAFSAYEDATRVRSMRYFGTEDPLFLTLGEDAGGSPDGLMGQGEDIMVGLELKCPLNPAIHFKYCGYKNQFALKDNEPDYYSQVQFLLTITKAPVWHWVSFDERFNEPKKRLKLIEVEPDKRWQQDIDIVIPQAIKERDKIIEQFLNS